MIPPEGWDNAPRFSRKRREKTRGAWRFASPSVLLLALVLFPLPWLEIQCNTA